MDFKEQLRRHLGFLDRSCIQFDAGHLDEALRIAVSLRVIFHDTTSSISLLKHLEIKESTNVLSTFNPGYKEDKNTGMTWVSIPILADARGKRIAPLGNATRREFLIANAWWNEIVAVMNHKFSRKNIILSASNKDGGAHVDANPDNKTSELIKGVGTLTTTHRGFVKKIPLDNQHFPILRQFAYEVLNSPEITRASLR